MGRIVSFGDSWTYGYELPHPDKENYTFLLGEKCGLPIKNYGSNGHSLSVITSIIFQSYSPLPDDIVLVCIPPDIRWMDEDNHGLFLPLFTLYDHIDDLENFNPQDTLGKQYKFFMEVMVNFKNWAPYHQLLHLFSIQSYLKSLNLSYLFFTNYGYIDFNFNFEGKIDKTHLLSDSLTTILNGKDSHLKPSHLNTDGPEDWRDIFVGEYFKGNDTHPNKKGHKIIADIIYNHKMFQKWLTLTTNTEN
jgi:hypothetical protein